LKERAGNNAKGNIFAALRKDGQQKPFWTEKKQHGRAVDPGVFNETMDIIKYLETNLALIWKFPNDAIFAKLKNYTLLKPTKPVTSKKEIN